MSSCARSSWRYGGATARGAWAAGALALAAHLTPAPTASAEPLDASARAAAAYLPLGASAALALDSSQGSALERVMQAQGQPAGPPAAPRSAPLAADAIAARLRSEPDLFGSTAIPIGATALSWRWRGAAFAALPRSASWTREVRELAQLPMAERLQRANAWVNRSIAFGSDAQVYGEADHWAGAREALARGRGDCEDYAVTKLQLLRAAGVPASSLYLVVVRDAVRRSDHAVLAVRLNGRFLVLDNGLDKVLDASAVHDYQPVMTFSSAGTWVHGFREPDALRVADNEVVTPAARPPT
jgi:predicted transglutaminase-like cysteine proteinase